MPQMSPMKWTCFILLMFLSFFMFMITVSFLPTGVSVPNEASGSNLKWKFMW